MSEKKQHTKSVLFGSFVKKIRSFLEIFGKLEPKWHKHLQVNENLRLDHIPRMGKQIKMLSLLISNSTMIKFSESCTFNIRIRRFGVFHPNSVFC